MKPFFIGIAGASGSGKSTLAKNLAAKYKTYAIDLDDYFINKKKIPFINLLYKKQVRDLIDLKIYLLAPGKILVRRRIQRTGKQNTEYYKGIVYPYYKKHALPTKKICG